MSRAAGATARKRTRSGSAVRPQSGAPSSRSLEVEGGEVELVAAAEEDAAIGSGSREGVGRPQRTGRPVEVHLPELVESRLTEWAAAVKQQKLKVQPFLRQQLAEMQIALDDQQFEKLYNKLNTMKRNAQF